MPAPFGYSHVVDSPASRIVCRLRARWSRWAGSLGTTSWSR